MKTEGIRLSEITTGVHGARTEIKARVGTSNHAVKPAHTEIEMELNTFLSVQVPVTS
jgi:hypothetical protein